MDEAALYEFLTNAEAQNPGALQKMIESGLFGDRAQMAGMDIAQGQKGVATPGAQGMSVGGTYVAASPLEHVATAMARIMGGNQMQAGKSSMQDLISGKGQGMEALIRAMTQGVGGGPAMPGAGWMGP